VEWTLKDLASSLSTPDAYYLKRGYRPETLEHFGVGTCLRPLPDGKNLPGWSIIPIPDLPNQPLCGYTARNPRWHDGSPYPKWYHAVSRRNCLFNSYAASKRCVMRFHEAGFPGGIATLGTTLTSGQYYKFLSIYYNQRVLIAADANEPGQKFAEELKRQIQGVCMQEPLIIYPPHGKDFGDLPTEEGKTFMESLGPMPIGKLNCFGSHS
jgi:hypothetical protein